MISTIVEYLQGIPMAKEALALDKNRLGNPANKYGHFTRANDANTRYTICSNTLWR
jgi:hypothetical protein